MKGHAEITGMFVDTSVPSLRACLVSHELASIGATVVIAARRLEPLQKTQKEITQLGGKCDIVHPLNVKEESSCYAAIETILKRHGRLDGWYFC